MTEAEAKEIVERYEALLKRLAGADAAMCDLPLIFAGEHVHVSETSYVEWPATRIIKRCSDAFRS